MGPIIYNNNQIRFFKNNGYCIINLLSREDINFIIKEITLKIINTINDKDIINFDISKYHKFVSDDTLHKRIINPNNRFIPVGNKLKYKIKNNKKVKEIINNCWGHYNYVIRWREYLPNVNEEKDSNRNKNNCIGFRIARPYKIAPYDVGGEHLDLTYSAASARVMRQKDDKEIIQGGKEAFLTLWTPMIGFNEKYTLRLSPKSHLINHPEKEILKQDKYISPIFNENYIKKFKFIRPRLKIGQAILFHPFLVHGSSFNYGINSRLSVEIRLYNKNADDWQD
jgi:hypothetical protein